MSPIWFLIERERSKRPQSRSLTTDRRTVKICFSPLPPLPSFLNCDPWKNLMVLVFVSSHHFQLKIDRSRLAATRAYALYILPASSKRKECKPKFISGDFRAISTRPARMTASLRRYVRREARDVTFIARRRRLIVDDRRRPR